MERSYAFGTDFSTGSFQLLLSEKEDGARKEEKGNADSHAGWIL